MWISVKLFSKTSVSLPNGLMNKMALVERMEVMHEFRKLDFCSLSLIWLQSLLSVQIPNTESSSEPPTWHHDLLSFIQPDPYPASAKTTICGLTGCFICHRSIPHSFAFDHVNSRQQVECGNGPMFNEFIGLIMISTISKQLA